MDEQSWLNMMDELSFDPNLHTFSQLQSAYAEKHRHYHTSAHIEACLALFNEHRNAATKPAEIECAIWFHDAIYSPMSKENELKSADWAAQFLRENGCSDETPDNVRSHILATVHNSSVSDPDTQLLVDIDLSILGSDKEMYRSFENNVRREYKWVPPPLYRRERRKILTSFLARKAIYFTLPLREKYENQARINLKEAILGLQ